MRMIFLFSTFYLISSCANIVAPVGGPKDETPPKIDSLSSSTFFKTLFEKDRITLTFNEFIQLENPGQGILFSPPLSYRPTYSLKKRSLRIDFDEREVLKENTTYTINFGDAVTDLTERNPAENLRYVFATGNVIDSLVLTGRIIDTKTNKAVENAILALYDQVNDSIVFAERPFYFAKSNEEGLAMLYNLKSDTFKVVGWVDENFNYKYDPYSEDFGFFSNEIILDSNWKDSLLQLTFFREIPPLKITTTTTEDYGIIKWKLNRDFDSLDFVLQNTNLEQQFMSHKNDSVFLWYQTKKDSIQLTLLLNQESYDTLSYPTPEKNIDFDSKPLTIISPRNDYPVPVVSNQPIEFKYSAPLKDIDSTKFQLYQDSSLFEGIFWEKFRLQDGGLEMIMKFENSEYELVFLPESFLDLFDRPNQDTLRFKLKIDPPENFGKVILSFNDLDSTKNYLVSLLPVKQTQPIFKTSIQRTTQKTVLCDFLKPGQYVVQIAIDLNNNNRWDTGNYLKNLQAEPLIIEEIPVIKANWEINYEVSMQ